MPTAGGNDSKFMFHQVNLKLAGFRTSTSLCRAERLSQPTEKVQDGGLGRPSSPCPGHRPQVPSGPGAPNGPPRPSPVPLPLASPSQLPAGELPASADKRGRGTGPPIAPQPERRGWTAARLQLLHTTGRPAP
ncbi:actin cytoskeleton-regulatory complex protein PAN1-like [Corapipo altera]|uniref:actin cytoskeleton-regulatory complex protein PAN1-like n=1 Tax=Corapipo altera TaxID=415028 RepID=UPI000FD6496A|nr:actin cytoskeleton-regulatory complex protein PAN1-like [Corapipo altera]